MDPASIAFAALAEEFRRMGRHEEAIQTCRAGLQRHPAYLSARVTLGRALIETGDYDAAREELETVLRSAPENLAAIRGLAQIHERLGQSTEMDPHLAAMMNAEVERISLAAAAAPPSAPAPDPVVEAAAAQVLDAAPGAAVALSEPEPNAETDADSERELVFAPPVEAGPDPAMLATLARLERFLVAIDAARHP